MPPALPTQTTWDMDKNQIEAGIQQRCGRWIAGHRIAGSNLQHTDPPSHSILSALNGSLFEPAQFAMTSPGKRMRPLLCLWAARNLSPELTLQDERLSAALEIGLATELLHCASLIVDDVQDGSEKRRGRPSVHAQWGRSIAINTGNWLYFEAITGLQESPLLRSKSEKVAALTQAALDMMLSSHMGQALDLACAHTPNFERLLRPPSCNDLKRLYESLALRKTAALMNFGVDACLQWLEADQTTRLQSHQLIELYGMIYQQADDLQNLCPELSAEKTNEDLKSLRNIVTVSLLEQESPAGYEAAFAAARSGQLQHWVLNHNRFVETLLKCADQVAEQLAEAELRARQLCVSEESWSYLYAVLHSPLERLSSLARKTAQSYSSPASYLRERELCKT